MACLDTVQMGPIIVKKAYESLWLSIYSIKQYTASPELTSSFIPTSFSTSSSCSSSLYKSCLFLNLCIPLPYYLCPSLFSHSPPPPPAYPSPPQTSYYQLVMHNQMILHVSLDEPGRMCRESLQLCKINITLI